MQSLRFLVFILLGISGPVFFACSRAGDKSTETTAQAEGVRLDQYLEKLGMTFDCYFTWEDKATNWGGGPRIESMHKGYDNTIASLPEALRYLSKELPGFEVYRSADNPAVVHIVETSLRKLHDYTLEQRRTIVYTGTPSGLLEELGGKCGDIGPKKDLIGSGGIWNVFDWTTRVRLNAKEMKIRQILTDCIPLSDYHRTLWAATTFPEENKWTTTVDYWGPLGRPTLPGDRPADYLRIDSNDTAAAGKFERGEAAFANTADIFGPNVEENSGRVAVRFIQARMQSGETLQVRWAMLFLGKIKAEEGIPVLLKYIDYRYTTCGILEESYPALKALRQIGKPAAESALKEIGKEKVELRRGLLCRVVLAVEGLEKTQKLLEGEIRNAGDDELKKRLEAALQYCATVEK